ncbi:MAG: hypothetical protein CML56_04610 [Rhodobacteraceae bacterium]|nr:hypothetical protein [Paracoccaceae bacterium]
MIPGFSLIALWATIAASGIPVTGLVENRPSDEWVVLEIQVQGAEEPEYMDYPTSLFPCDPHEGQKFFGAIRPNGKLLITKCSEKP